MFLILSQCFNRTIVELRLNFIVLKIETKFRFNRTIVELRLNGFQTIFYACFRFNRTIVELRQTESLINLHQ